MSIESVRITKEGRDLLLALKRRTGIGNWNVLCRWAFCASLAEPTAPREQRLSGEAAVEMTWKTFGGEYDAIYLALLKHRCKQEGRALTAEGLDQTLRLHIHRGVGYLAGDPHVKSIGGLIAKGI